MPQIITVTARESFLHEGVAKRPGDVFTVSPVMAAVLKYQARVVLGDHPELAESAAPRKKRAYKRRDLTAER